MTYHIPITQSDLQAYTDGQLSPARQREVEEYLLENPEAAAMVEDYRQINDSLHEMFDPVLDEPVPEQLSVKRVKTPFKVFRLVATMAWVMIGGVIGWQLHPAAIMVAEKDTLSTHLVKPAAFAHIVYTPEVQHPVEVTAGQQKHLVKWLSKRLHTDIKAPNLTEHGYELVGGRLLPSTNRMAAQFMYQRSDGMRVTLYNRRGVWGNKHTAFQYKKQNDTAVFYWIDGPLGFALVGKLSKEELLELSEVIYNQFN